MLRYLKSQFSKPAKLTAGSVIALGSTSTTPERDCLWRVCTVRPFAGIPHAMIEQLSGGTTKTLAVSALMSDPTFQVVRPYSV